MKPAGATSRNHKVPCKFKPDHKSARRRAKTSKRSPWWAGSYELALRGMPFK